jgi:hypothetical protein
LARPFTNQGCTQPLLAPETDRKAEKTTVTRKFDPAGILLVTWRAFVRLRGLMRAVT